MLVAAYLLAVFITIFAAFALVTFSPIRQVRQPARSLILGFGSSGMAGLWSMPLALFGDRAVWLALFFIGVLITGIGGVLIGLLGSTEGISTKTKDDFSPKRGNDQWWSWGS
jgi:hypothetical protein